MYEVPFLRDQLVSGSGTANGTGANVLSPVGPGLANSLCTAMCAALSSRRPAVLHSRPGRHPPDVTIAPAMVKVKLWRLPWGREWVGHGSVTGHQLSPARVAPFSDVCDFSGVRLLEASKAAVTHPLSSSPALCGVIATFYLSPGGLTFFCTFKKRNFILFLKSPL